jgi:GLPGLI family protein
MGRMLKIYLILALFLHAGQLMAQGRQVAECTIVYQLFVADKPVGEPRDPVLQQSLKTIYVKGNQIRVDLKSPDISQTIIYNKSLLSGAVLREIGDARYLTRLNPTVWLKLHEKYKEVKTNLVKEKRNIIGYDCLKAELSLPDGTTYHVWYAPNLVPTVKEFEYQFRQVPGLVLEYESVEDASRKILYRAVSVSLSPVPANKFEIPTSG